MGPNQQIIDGRTWSTVFVAGCWIFAVILFAGFLYSAVAGPYYVIQNNRNESYAVKEQARHDLDQATWHAAVSAWGLAMLGTLTTIAGRIRNVAALLMAVFALGIPHCMAAEGEPDLTAFNTATEHDIYREQLPPTTLGRPDIIPDHLGPLWAEHLKREKAQRLIEQRERDAGRTRLRTAAKQAAAKAADDAKFRQWTKADGLLYLEAKPKSYAQGVLTLVDRDGKSHKIGKGNLSADDRLYLEKWIKSH